MAGGKCYKPQVIFCYNIKEYKMLSAHLYSLYI